MSYVLGDGATQARSVSVVGAIQVRTRLAERKYAAPSCADGRDGHAG